MTLNEYSSKLQRLSTQHKLAKEQVVSEEQALIKAEASVVHITEAQKIFQSLAQETQERVHTQICGVVSRCLQDVFEDPYEFRIFFEQKRGKTEARLVFLRDGYEVNPLRGAGGGTVDLATFALRLVVLVMSQPARRKFLVLDEPFKWLSAEYVPLARELLTKLSNEMGVQFLIVTHNKELHIGKVVELS